MGKNDSRTVVIASCHSPAEAMMIKAVLSARGIEAIIPGAASSSMTSAAVGFSSRVLVDSEVAEEAAALIAELRSAPLEEEAGEGEGGDDGDEDDKDDERREEWAPGGELATSVRRRQLIATLCLSVAVTFGTGHLLNRAWGRALVLAGAEVLGLLYLVEGQRLGLVFVLGAMALDLLGSVILVNRRYPAKRQLPLPSAKLLPKSRP